MKTFLTKCSFNFELNASKLYFVDYYIILTSFNLGWLNVLLLCWFFFINSPIFLTYSDLNDKKKKIRPFTTYTVFAYTWYTRKTVFSDEGTWMEVRRTTKSWRVLWPRRFVAACRWRSAVSLAVCSPTVWTGYRWCCHCFDLRWNAPSSTVFEVFRGLLSLDTVFHLYTTGSRLQYI